MKTLTTFSALVACALFMSSCEKESAQDVGPKTITAEKKGGGGNTATVMNLESVTVEGKLKFKKHVGPYGWPEYTYFGEYAFVKVVDQNGVPVGNATVTGNWGGCFSSTASAVTNNTGVAEVFGASSPSSQCTLTFTVTGVAKSGSQYNPLANVTSSGSKTYN